MSKVYYREAGSHLFRTNQSAIPVHNEVPAGTYSVGISMEEGYYLTKIDNMRVEGKIYGDVHKKADRILNTYSNRPSNTGVLLSGEKGSGKTLLGKILSLTLLEKGIATLVVNQPLFGEGFNRFLQDIKQPCMVFFDEFEKVYNMEDQQKLLTLFDGTYDSKKLFVLTCNEMRISNYFLNRPGRIFYSFKYEGLEKDFIEEYVEDNLKNKEHQDALLNLCATFKSLNFDVLKAFVEEMNRYDEPCTEAMKFINATPLTSTFKFKIDELKGPDELIITNCSEEASDGQLINPFSSYFWVEIKNSKKKSSEKGMPITERLLDDEDDDGDLIYFYPKDVKKVKGDKIYCINDSGYYVSLVKIPPKEMSFGHLFVGL